MSDTDTRTVAEIIGWHDSETARSVPKEPTPDDMLAWLRERFVGVDIQVGASVAVEPWPNHRIIVGETLHAALEAAVRAVAEDK